MDFITAFLQGGASVATAFGEVLRNSVNAITQVFWIPGVEGAAGQLTIVGAGLALALGVGAVYLIFRLIRGLIKQNDRG